MATTRDRIAAAAIELLGTEGLRSLTHRRVDDRAHVPVGSTSNHFRTRAALLEGAIDGIVAG
ncbi:MAG: TetR family transcriptional regulator, partial [Agrococcus sp.]